jgi:hypothetical protein
MTAAKEQWWYVMANNQVMGVYMTTSAIEALAAAAARHGPRVREAVDVAVRLVDPAAVLVIRIVESTGDDRVSAEAWRMAEPHDTVAQTSKVRSVHEAIETIAQWAEPRGFVLITEAELVDDADE